MARAELDLSLAQVAESLGQGLLITDRDARILYVNPAFTALTGYSCREAVGQNPRMLQSGRQPPAFYRRMWDAITRTGGWQGEIVNRRKDGQPFTEWITISAVRDGAGAVTNYVAVFSDVSKRKREFDASWHRAHHDPLTGLANRPFFMAQLRQAMAHARRHQGLVAVVFLDLDGFKAVNDQLGHAAGDRVLREVARRLRRSVRETDATARLGGDEFAVVLTEVGDMNAARWSCEKILSAVRLPIGIDGEAVHPAASLGVAVFPFDGTNPSVLLGAADDAMYRAKTAGKNAVRFTRAATSAF